MPRFKTILEKVSKGHLKQITIMEIMVIKIMWNRIYYKMDWGIGLRKQWHTYIVPLGMFKAMKKMQFFKISFHKYQDP
jgi:hypothetical protein